MTPEVQVVMNRVILEIREVVSREKMNLEEMTDRTIMEITTRGMA